MHHIFGETPTYPECSSVSSHGQLLMYLSMHVQGAERPACAHIVEVPRLLAVYIRQVPSVCRAEEKYSSPHRESPLLSPWFQVNQV